VSGGHGGISPVEVTCCINPALEIASAYVSNVIGAIPPL
tara:strand:+ start:11 stop:127 length:117 start_codon:yes stop_codon:yes gene_type:complete